MWFVVHWTQPVKWPWAASGILGPWRWLGLRDWVAAGVKRLRRLEFVVRVPFSIRTIPRYVYRGRRVSSRHGVPKPATPGRCPSREGWVTSSRRGRHALRSSRGRALDHVRARALGSMYGVTPGQALRSARARRSWPRRRARSPQSCKTALDVLGNVLGSEAGGNKYKL